jgi:hypothetical protein
MTTIKTRQEFLGEFLPNYHGDNRVAALEDAIVEMEELEECGRTETAQYRDAKREMKRLEDMLLLESLDAALESGKLTKA